ncbi:permease [Natrialbaceae archaeon A-arb3/5]
MAAESAGDGYLFDLYRRYIGEPEARTDVYLGFGLFLGGIGLAAVALVLFLWSSTLEPRSPTHIAWVQPAYALVMVSLPILMLGIVVLLPSERRVRYASVGGVVVTVIAVGGFLYAYPYDWNGHGNDYTAEVVAVYAVGLAGITASTGAALIAHYLDMARTVERVEHEADEESDEESYSDAEIERDIDEAMEGVELSWGGVEKTEHKRLSFSEDDFDDVSVDVDMEAKTTRSSGVDSQVAGLKGLKGGETKTTTSQSTVDDQTAKLRELREQQQADDEADRSDSESPVSTILDRIRSVFGRN